MDAASCGLASRLRGLDPLLPGVRRVTDRHAAAVPHERSAEQARLGQRALEQALGRVEGDAQTERLVAGTLAIDQGAGAEFLDEASELAARRRTLLQVDEVDGDTALLEEALRLARVLAIGEAEDLRLDRRHDAGPPDGGSPGASSASRARRSRSSRQALSGTGCTPGFRTPPTRGPWKSEPPVATRPSREHISRYAVICPEECSG